MPSQPQQLTPYWDTSVSRFEGPNGVYASSPDVMQGMQAGNAATATIPLGIASRPGVIFDARAAAQTVLTGNDTCTIDIKKNGASILTAPIALASGDAARASKVGTLTGTLTVVAGDFFEAVVTATHNTGTLPANICFQVSIYQN